jgi:glycosyltransferase involved in cell wall biosynthesis
LWSEVIDYQVYDQWPGWWRRIEQLARFDIGLAWEVRKRAGEFDIVWTWSEKTSIPLALMGLRQPLFTVVHHMSALKKLLIRLTRAHKKWYAVGYISDHDREILKEEFGIPSDRLFRAISAPLDRFSPCPPADDCGPIISLGVARRDYPTLISALEGLPGYDTEIYVSSKYGDKYHGALPEKLPPWVRRMNRVDADAMPDCYNNGRFVVLPLLPSLQSGAGATVALEAACYGKAIIATRTQGTPSFIVDGQTGILVPPGDVQALRSAIRRLYENPALAQRMGLAGREFVEANFHPQVIDGRIKQLLCQASASG